MFATRRSPYRPHLEALEVRRVPSAFTVTTTVDAGPGSLRQAILDADNDAGPNTIAFNIPGAGAQVIAAATPLPDITTPTTLDGTTQPGYSQRPLIRLLGPGAGDGLRFTLVDGAMDGLALDGFQNAVHEIRGNLAMRGDYITANSTGVFLEAPGNPAMISDCLISGNTTGLRLLGGNSTIQDNQIVANGTGVLFDQAGIGGNMVQGNAISANTLGVEIGVRNTTLQGNRIAGNGTGARLDGSSDQVLDNTIAANRVDGVNVASTQNLIQDNFIRRNGRDGVRLEEDGTLNTLIGNTISGNGADGIYTALDRTTIQGNLIAGNRGNGIQISGIIGPDTVGGYSPDEANVITNNSRDGVLVEGTTGVSILGNSISNSGKLGIELADGANQDQAEPVLDSAVVRDGRTVVFGTLTSTRNTTFTLEFVANDAPNGSGYGEGQTWLGDATVTTDASGQVSFTVSVAAALPGQIVTATATGPYGTSEFSAWIPVIADIPWHKDETE
jgi:parallel beta-helix repeat protein